MLRYVERNALHASLVPCAEQWRCLKEIGRKTRHNRPSREVHWATGPKLQDMALIPKKPLRPRPPSVGTISTSYLESFVAYVAGECHLADNTVAAYRRDTKRFFQWLQARAVAALTIRDLADYVGWLHGQKLNPTSIARHIASLRVFFRYLQLEGVLVESQAELLGSQKLWERVPKVLSPAQVNRLFETPKPGDPCWRRDRALLELLYATGCRASELSHLKLHDLHLDEGYCTCRGKGDKQRMVPLGAKAAAAVRSYLEHERGPLAGQVSPPPEWVLLSCRGRRLRRERIWELMKRYALRAGARRRSVPTPCGTASPRTCSPAAPICGRCKKCWATPALPPRRFTRTSIPRG